MQIVDDEDFEVNVEALDERRIDVFSENEEEISEKLKKLEVCLFIHHYSFVKFFGFFGFPVLP